jgi:hypothetical protein
LTQGRKKVTKYATPIENISVYSRLPLQKGNLERINPPIQGIDQHFLRISDAFDRMHYDSTTIRDTKERWKGKSIVCTIYSYISLLAMTKKSFISSFYIMAA